MSSSYPHRLHVPISNPQKKALELISKRRGQSFAYIARTAIVEYLKKHGHKRSVCS